MAIRAVIQMRRGWNTIQLVLMTISTVTSSGSGDQTAMIRGCGMDCIPGGAVTCLAVAARREGLGIGAASRYQGPG